MPMCKFNIKKSLLLICLFSFISSLSAHEFWLSPDRFIYKRTEEVNIRFLVGENFEGENWKGNNEKIKSLEIYYGGVNDDLSPVVSDATGDSIEYFMIDEGTNMVAFNSTNSFIELEPSKFQDYLEEDGLTNAMDYRKQNNELGCNGREFYQRCAKTLVQVGDVKDNTFSFATDLVVDIIPYSNPYLLKDKELFRAKIFYNRSPVVYGLVKVWHRINGKTVKKEFHTDANGEIGFPVITEGKWMISIVQMARIADNAIADWQSYWGSLTWGYE